MEMPLVLVLGCVGSGNCHQHVCAGDVNLDLKFSKEYKNMVVHDLNRFPYPFKDNEFEKVFASHILEHLDDPQRAIIEMLRVGRTVEIFVPHRYSRFGVGNGHRHVFSKAWFGHLLLKLPVNFEVTMSWESFPYIWRPRDIHVIIVKKENGKEKKD